MTDIEIINISYTEVTRERNPEDEWDADDTCTSNNIEGFRIIKPNSRWKSVDLTVDFEPKVDKTYYLVYVIYSTGDSFSHHEGCVDYIFLYENLEFAEATKKMIEDAYKKKDKEESYSVEIFNDKGELFKISSSSWVGYFETLTDVVIDYVTLKQ